jgi:DNA-binding NarL/FixJ family response regulator
MTDRTIAEASLTCCEPHASGCERTRRLLVVHRFPIVRFGVVKLVEERLPGMAIAETGTVSQALRSVQDSDWDLVVIGLSFGDGGGLELLKALKELRATLRVLVITAHSEALYARRCFKAGAAGLVTKESSLTEVIDAIQAVMSGRRYVSPRVTGTLAAWSRSRPAEPASRVLSDRELEVMRLLTWGKTIREIASLLSMSTRTASACRSRVLEKLAMTNAA